MDKWPDFFLIGAMKAGSTTLYDHLNIHPDIYMSNPKEPGFFSRDERFEKGEQWYELHFKQAKCEQLWGDASTCYSRYPTYAHVVERIHKVNPHAKFLYVVRDPVDRAYSHYRHRMGEAIKNAKPVISYKDSIKNDEELLLSGKYYFQIKQFHSLFGGDNFHVCTFEEMVEDTANTLDTIYTFLGLSSVELNIDQSSLKSNEAGSSLADRVSSNKLKQIRQLPVLKQVFDVIPDSLRRSIFDVSRASVRLAGMEDRIAKKHRQSLPKPDESDIRYLAEFYKEDVLALQSLTGKDLSHWTSLSI